MLGCVWKRNSSMRVFHEPLDTLTQPDYAYPTAHIGSTGLVSWFIRRVNAPLHCGFFAREISSPRYDGVSKALARVAGPGTGRPTLFILSPMIGLVGDRFNICLPGTIMNTLQNTSVQNLPVVFWQDQPVITTESLANVYEVDVTNIQMNFKRNAGRFIEGQHYFKLEGEQLTNFKLVSSQIPKQTKHLFLWTERGTVRHAKMLGTDQAWDVQDQLEQFYFSQKAAASPIEPAKPLPPPVQIPLTGIMILELVNGEVVSCQPKSRHTWIFDAGTEPGIRKLVNEYIPAQNLGTLMNAVMERMQAIAAGKQGMQHA